MTQGYGPDNGQQGNWGQQPQWGQNDPGQPQAAPQWGQPSPQDQWSQQSQQPQWGPTAPTAPGGYPGTAGHSAGSSSGADGIDWRRVKLLGTILLVCTALLLLIRMGYALSALIGAEGAVAANSGGELGAVDIGSSLISLVLMGANALVGVVVLIVGIIAAVMGRARARLGGIIAAVGIPLSIVTYWLVNIVAAVILISIGLAEESGELTVGSYRIMTSIDAVRNLVIIAIIGLGGFFVVSTASKKLRG